MSTGVSNVLKQNATEVERTLLGVSAEVARNFVGKADEITTAVSTRAAEMTRILDDNSASLLTALTGKSQEFTERGQPRHRSCGEGDRSQGLHLHADHDGQQRAHRPPDQRGERERDQRAHPDDAGGQHRHPDGDRRLHRRRSRARSRSCRTAPTPPPRPPRRRSPRRCATCTSRPRPRSSSRRRPPPTAVSEMLETHGMLRSDTTALFERLREANILLQEVLSGAHENMSAIENTLVTRVSEFVTTMNEVAREDRHREHPGRAAHQRVPHRHHQDARPTCRSLRPSSTRTAARWPRRSR